MKRMIVSISFLFIISGCSKSKANPVIEEVGMAVTAQSYCDTVTQSFSGDILPIFILNCSTSGCHNSGTAASGYVFETHSQLSNHNIMSPALSTMKHESGFSPMPKFSQKLNDSLIQKIECWISQGKLDN